MSSKDSDEPIQRDPISRSSGGGGAPDSQPVGDEDDEAVSATDTEASSPHGVGESIGRRGEDVGASDGKEAGRQDQGTEGQAQRPVGTSDLRDVTSVDPDDR